MFQIYIKHRGTHNPVDCFPSHNANLSIFYCRTLVFSITQNIIPIITGILFLKHRHLYPFQLRLALPAKNELAIHPTTYAQHPIEESPATAVLKPMPLASHVFLLPVPTGSG